MPSRDWKGARLRVAPILLWRAKQLRHPQTPAEKRLWNRLRDHALGFHARRQDAILDRFIVDFYVASARLCIEIDGDTHAEADQEAYDRERARILKKHGYRVIRFSNADVMENPEGVLRAIQEACARLQD